MLQEPLGRAQKAKQRHGFKFGNVLLRAQSHRSPKDTNKTTSRHKTIITCPTKDLSSVPQGPFPNSPRANWPAYLQNPPGPAMTSTCSRPALARVAEQLRILSLQILFHLSSHRTRHGPRVVAARTVGTVKPTEQGASNTTLSYSQSPTLSPVQLRWNRLFARTSRQ